MKSMQMYWVTPYFSKMAARREVDFDELAPFVLDNVEGLKEDSQEAGRGAYGVIYNVTVNGLQYVAKRLHKALVDKVENSQNVKKKFRNECITLSRLKHPNIVHFIGVHYGKERSDLTLIMECLPSDLSSYLETHTQVSLHRKLSILLDVTYGLLYLHTHDPQIIHRDLTARNVLLTIDCHAKIADLGVAKLLTPQALAAVNRNTTAPGHPSYMPPEALTENPECTPKIDIFSFGHLSLFTINEEDPQLFEIIDVPTKTKEQGCIQVSRRRPSVEKVGQDHCMYPLIIGCLHDNPASRPVTAKLAEEMHRLCTSHPLIPLEKGVKDLIQVSQDNRELQTRLVKFAKAIDGEMEQNKIICALESETNNLKTQLESAQAQVLVFQSDFADERRDREIAHSKLADLERELARHKTLLADATMDYNWQLKRIKEEAETAKTELEETKAALARAEASNKKLKETKEYWREQVAKSTAKCHEHTAELEEFKKSCQTKEDHLKHLKKDLDKKSGELDKMTKKVQKQEESRKSKKRTATVSSDGTAPLEASK